MKSLKISLPMVAVVMLLIVWGAESNKTPHPRISQLVAVGNWNKGYDYRFSDLSSCEVSDGNLGFIVKGGGSVYITDVKLKTEHFKQLDLGFEVLKFETGTSTGEIAMSQNLEAMKSGTRLETKNGRVKVEALPHEWYFIVVQAKLLHPIEHPWKIDGATIFYVSKGKKLSVFIKQSISLPSAKACPKNLP